MSKKALTVCTVQFWQDQVGYDKPLTLIERSIEELISEAIEHLKAIPTFGDVGFNPKDHFSEALITIIGNDGYHLRHPMDDELIAAIRKNSTLRSKGE